MTDAASGLIVLVGAGNMGGAMMAGWLDAGIAPERILVIDPSPRPDMAERMTASGVRHAASVPEGVTADVMLVAVKPQIMDAVLPALKPAVGAETVVVSVAAGKTIASMAAHLGDCAIIRTIPNTPAMIGRGITAAVGNDAVTEAQRTAVDELLAVSGEVEWVDEEGLIDAVTAVSGSGPAYIFHLAECMAEAGRKAGLPADLAMRLARATVSGAGEMLRRSPDGPDVLRKNVTSPNGTTAAALDVLMQDDAMMKLFETAIAAARDRSRELAG